MICDSGNKYVTLVTNSNTEDELLFPYVHAKCIPKDAPNIYQKLRLHQNRKLRQGFSWLLLRFDGVLNEVKNRVHPIFVSFYIIGVIFASF